MRPIDVFVLVSGSFSVLTTVPIIMLAVWSTREARQLRRIQSELAELMGESHGLAEEIRGLQHGLRREQKEAFARTRQEVKDVTEAVEQVGLAVSDVGGAIEQAGESTAAAVNDLRPSVPPGPRWP